MLSLVFEFTHLEENARARSHAADFARLVQGPPPHLGLNDAAPAPQSILNGLSVRNQSALTQALPGRLGMWSDLLVAFLMSMPALIYGAVQWLTYLQ